LNLYNLGILLLPYYYFTKISYFDVLLSWYYYGFEIKVGSFGCSWLNTVSHGLIMVFFVLIMVLNFVGSMGMEIKLKGHG